MRIIQMLHKLILLALAAGIVAFAVGCASTRPTPTIEITAVAEVVPEATVEAEAEAEAAGAAGSELSKLLKAEVLTMETVRDFLTGCGVYYLATVDGDQPRVRPFGTAAIFEGRLYIQTGKVKNVAKQIVANPKVEICAYDQKGGAWLRVEATLVADERVEAKQAMLDQYPNLASMYSATDDNTFVLYMKDATATFYSFGGEPRVVRF